MYQQDKIQEKNQQQGIKKTQYKMLKMQKQQPSKMTKLQVKEVYRTQLNGKTKGYSNIQ